MNKFEQQWLEKYELAKKYYEYYGNLEIPEKFKTINGYEYDEDGIALGRWIQDRRNAFHSKGNCKITNDQIKLLEKIGMRFEKINSMDAWMEKYNLAKVYYEHYGNLEVPTHFKTINGYDYDEDGIALGIWLVAKRQANKGNTKGRITEKQMQLLKEIGMRFENIDTMDSWMEKYDLAKIYYEHHGDLKIPQRFKTINGYKYDENGIPLGRWIRTQRRAFQGKGTATIDKQKIDLLKQIGMNFDNIKTTQWMNMYNLAKTYYEHYGNLEIPQSFKTLNGYEYDEQGVALGQWLANRKLAYKNIGAYNITEQQIKLLNEIGMVWDYDDILIKQRKINLKTPSYIYAIVNLINNKKYIGQSIDPEKRFKSHWYDNKIKIDKTMREYGLSNFKLEILEKTTLEFVNEREQYWINKFNTLDPEYGYNIQKGGTTLARFK